MAELLAREGSQVDLAVNGLYMGEALPFYVRDATAAALHRLGVRVTSYARLVGSFGDTVFMQHTASELPIEFEAVETLVLSTGHLPFDGLRAEIAAMGIECHPVGDCQTPRTAEEARNAWETFFARSNPLSVVCDLVKRVRRKRFGFSGRPVR